MMATAGPVVVLGGSGFVGRHLVAKLASDGRRVVVPTRRRGDARHLILLPTVDVVEADIHDPTALARLARNAFAIVNLVGILHERASDTFARVHVELASKIVTACRVANVTRLVHMSAQNADADAPSRYLRSKAEGEAIVRGSGLAWTVFRPSIVFGPGDTFLNLFAALEKRLPVIALASPQARFQPISVADVAHCFAHAIDDDATVGHAYGLCGPTVYTLREIVDYVGRTTGHARPVVPLGPGLSKVVARTLELLPGHIMTRDNLASMERDSVCEGPFPPVFGIAPTTLESVAPSYLSPASVHSKYDPLRAHGGR